jgi:CrcB protein
MAGPPPPSLSGLGAVATGGVVGASLRYGAGRLVPVTAGAFPWTTFVVNVSGSLALGALVVVAAVHWPGWHTPRLFLGVGVLGAFTTFSTFANETRALLLADAGGTAASYVGASVAGGLASAWLGIGLARRILGVPPGGLPEQPEEAA